MNLGEKVVCINDHGAFGLEIGKIYTVVSQYSGRYIDCYYLDGLDSSWLMERFKPLEEMQNTNFSCVAGKEIK